MKMISLKLIALISIVLVGPLAMARVINCATVGQIVFNGDQANITYSARMGFQDTQDVAYYIAAGETSTVLQANKWGAYIEVPNALLNGKVKQADIRFVVNQSDDFYDACTALHFVVQAHGKN